MPLRDSASKIKIGGSWRTIPENDLWVPHMSVYTHICAPEYTHMHTVINKQWIKLLTEIIFVGWKCHFGGGLSYPPLQWLTNRAAEVQRKSSQVERPELGSELGPSLWSCFSATHAGWWAKGRCQYVVGLSLVLHMSFPVCWHFVPTSTKSPLPLQCGGCSRRREICGTYRVFPLPSLWLLLYVLFRKCLSFSSPWFCVLCPHPLPSVVSSPLMFN